MTLCQHIVYYCQLKLIKKYVKKVLLVFEPTLKCVKNIFLLHNQSSIYYANSWAVGRSENPGGVGASSNLVGIICSPL